MIKKANTLLGRDLYKVV